MLRVTVHDRLDEIDPDEWDALTRDPFSRTAVLGALEAAAMPGVRLWYATVRDARGSLRAAAPLARLPIDGGRLTHGAFRAGISWARHVHPGFLRTSLLLCGTPLSVGNRPVRLDPAVDPVRTYHLLAGVLDDLGRGEQVPWRVFKEFHAADVTAARIALTAGRRRWVLASSEPGNELSLPWRSYDGFLRSLRSHYRYKIRTAARRCADAGVVVDTVPLRDAYDHDAHRLYEAVADRAVVQLERLTPAFFRALGRAAGDAAVLIRFRQAGVLVGWVATLRAHRTLYDLFHGIDYAHNEPLALYFNQLATVVRYGTELGVRRIVLGQSTDTAKARFGAHTVPLWIALAHRTRAVTSAMHRSQHVLFPAAAPVERHVFHA